MDDHDQRDHIPDEIDDSVIDRIGRYIEDNGWKTTDQIAVQMGIKRLHALAIITLLKQQGRVEIRELGSNQLAYRPDMDAEKVLAEHFNHNAKGLDEDQIEPGILETVVDCVRSFGWISIEDLAQSAGIQERRTQLLVEVLVARGEVNRIDFDGTQIVMDPDRDPADLPEMNHTDQDWQLSPETIASLYGWR